MAISFADDPYQPQAIANHKIAKSRHRLSFATCSCGYERKMGQVMKTANLLSIVGLILVASSAGARVFHDWSYDDLVKGSDLIVIANVVESKVGALTDDLSQNGLGNFSYSYNQLETVLQVRTVLKGKYDQKLVSLVHFRYSPKDLLSIDNGPTLFEFPKSDQRTYIGNKEWVNGPEYLLFLKVRSDGKYAPVTGQVDPVLSVRVLGEPLPFVPGGRMEKN